MKVIYYFLKVKWEKITLHLRTIHYHFKLQWKIVSIGHKCPTSNYIIWVHMFRMGKVVKSETKLGLLDQFNVDMSY